VGVPTSAGRVEILKLHLSNLEHCVTAQELSDLGDSCHGFVGADLMSLCEKAAWSALRRALVWQEEEGTAVINNYHQTDQRTDPREGAVTKIENGEDQTTDDVAPPQITYADLLDARARTTPSALRQVVVDVAKVAWTDVGGQENVKQQLKEAVEWPLKHPEAFERMGVSPPQGVLLYGPPGCSKTLLAKAIATQGQMNFIAVKGPELFSKWVGDSEKQVMQIFRKARASAPSVIFFDEIDALASARGGDGGGSAGVGDRVLSQMLIELDGMHSRKGVVVVAATNRPDIVDSALLRPGRLDRILYVPPPDSEARISILNIHSKRVPLADDVDLRALAECTSGFSGAELRSVCREGALAALREDMSATVVLQRHFVDAIEQTTPQITEAMLQFYKGFADSRKSA
jgi:SpoVK/Ycf46/Vps4 family AAA+-type ATPase